MSDDEEAKLVGLLEMFRKARAEGPKGPNAEAVGDYMALHMEYLRRDMEAIGVKAAGMRSLTPGAFKPLPIYPLPKLRKEAMVDYSALMGTSYLQTVGLWLVRATLEGAFMFETGTTVLIQATMHPIVVQVQHYGTIGQVEKGYERAAHVVMQREGVSEWVLGEPVRSKEAQTPEQRADDELLARVREKASKLYT